MKIFTACLLFTALLFSSSIDPGKKAYSKVLDERFPGGSKGFLEFVYQRITFPPNARMACAMGETYVKMTVTPKGEVKDFQILNTVHKSYDKEIKRVLNLTNGMFLEADTSSTLEFSIAYELGNANEIHGDIKVTALPISGPNNNCVSMKKLELDLKKALEKKKYKRAKGICEKLLKRSPRKQLYLDAMSLIKHKIAKKK